MVKYCNGDCRKKKKRKFRWVYNRYPGAPKKKIEDPNEVVVNNFAGYGVVGTEKKHWWNEYVDPALESIPFVKSIVNKDPWGFAIDLGSIALGAATGGAGSAALRGLGKLGKFARMGNLDLWGKLMQGTKAGPRVAKMWNGPKNSARPFEWQPSTWKERLRYGSKAQRVLGGEAPDVGMNRMRNGIRTTVRKNEKYYVGKKGGGGFYNPSTPAPKPPAPKQAGVERVRRMFMKEGDKYYIPRKTGGAGRDEKALLKSRMFERYRWSKIPDRANSRTARMTRYQADLAEQAKMKANKVRTLEQMKRSDRWEWNRNQRLKRLNQFNANNATAYQGVSKKAVKNRNLGIQNRNNK
uniref:Uncharacterized protein n=1 Tax=Red panda feces-associated crucivirus TaxID=2864022 RepID=A0A8K1M4K1_9VIRU|nr:hypothetical protein 1 [Red panda feces-associated crucivirus]